MLCFKGSGDKEVSCYGTPKSERRKKPRSAKKSATEPIVYETTMNDRNGNLSSARQSIPGGVEYNQISRRIIALTYPTNGSDSGYRHSIKEISEKLRRNYADKYKVFNVSQKRSDLGRANTGAVVELGWPDQLAPPLDRLCSICKQIENWLNTNPENLVVIHCKGWRSRAAIVIAAYMHYTNICAGDESVEDRFGMKVFSEKFLGVDGQPSHKRYVRYFANLLSGTTKVNPAPIFLTNISLKKINGKGIVLKIYERMKPVYSSQPISIKSSAEIEIDNGLSLRGDVLVKCFEKRSGSDRSLVFQCQFNTCALDLETQRPILHFYREELDLITSDRSLDNQAAIEFSFVFEPPKEKKFVKSSKRSLSLSSSIGGGRGDQREGEFSRADSYENFDRPEDDRSISTSLIESAHPRPPSVSEGTTSALYTELQKTTATGNTTSSSQQPSPLDGADSGIGSDSPKQTMAPPVPPKPRRPSSSMDLDPDDPMRSAYEDSTIGRDRSVLPASVRPSSRTSNHQNSTNNNHQQNQNQQQQRAPSPAESTATGRSATPRIEPDLVAKDRYDPSSKCFSYVPAKALKEHYTAPKKPPTSRRQSMERSDLDIPTMDKESLRNISITPTTELTRRAETPKWDAVVDKIAPKIDLPDVRKNFRQLEKERYNGGGDYFSKTLPNGYTSGSGYGGSSSYGRDDDEFEKPVIVDQAKKAPPPRRRGRYGSYSTTNDDYNSDMDDLMDPEFYLSYSAAPTPPPDRFAPGSKSVELPRKHMKTISQRDLDEIDSIIESTNTLPPARSCYTPKPEPPRPSAERDAFRLRNCRSVNSGPTTRKLFSNERYDSITDAENPDDWLKNKLRTLHSKRGGYPDAMQRKNTEKKLLEELKNANPNNQLQKGEYVSEGIGQQQHQQQQYQNNKNGGMNDSQIDLIEEYQKEEERLRNTRSPFTAIDDFRSMNRAQTGTPNSMIGNGSSRYGRGTTPTSQIIRSKPPTPPPRERSKSPTIRSPQPFRKSATPSAYQQERNRIASTEYLSDDDDDTEFSHLQSLVNDNSKRAQTAEPSNYYSSSNGTGTKSILKRGNNRQSQNGTPISYADSLMDDRSEKKDIYASPVPSSRRFGANSTRTTSFGEDSLPRGGGSSYASIDSPRVGGASASSTPLPFSPGRSETPAFPVSNRETPLPFHPLLYQGAAGGDNNNPQQQQQTSNSLVHRSNSPRSMYYGQSRRSSMTSVEGGEVIHHHPVFVKDTSKYWYKPTISREEAINMLRDKSPGTFVVRDSNSFPGAFGLALKVAKPPEGVLPGDGSELVRHFLIEPSSKGVKLKGCNNEPVFGTLAALVYQHSITPMALPCRLLLPEYDPASTPEHLNAAQALLEQGAACNVTYIYSFDTESLTGPEAVRRAVHEAMEQYARGIVRAVNVHFKVSSQGITLTDNTRTLFFRRHYPTNSVIFAGIDPEDRKWDNNSVIQLPPTYVRQARVFGFVARKISTKADNACHVFAELDPEQPATAVVNFITKVMMGNSEKRGRTLPPV